MQWSLFVLVLMGQCTFCVCRYKYRFVKEKKNWTEAQKYCREHYTDLATVFNMTDVLSLSQQYDGEAWIGLSNDTKANRTWHWSLPGVKSDGENWDNNEPNDINQFENCVRVKNGKWQDVDCPKEQQFICYDGTNQSSVKFHKITTPMKWPKAQNYCRERYTDLISGLDQLNKFSPLQPGEWWIGLFRDRWKWSDNSSSSFRHWDLEKFEDDEGKNCAMTLPNGNWNSDKCNESKPFFCYDDELILIHEKKNWMDALDYCREHHHDLVTITNHEKQKWVEEEAMNATSECVWLGMRFTCTLDLWFWVNDNLVCYDNWAPGENREGCDLATAMRNDGKWVRKSESDKCYFICTKKKMINTSNDDMA